MKRTREIASLSEMIHFASEIAPQLGPGDLLLLSGPLGAGKTTFAQALIRQLGVTEQVTSPTFVMVKNYSGRFAINHIDAYRLLDLPNPRQALEELDIDFESSLTIIEWGEGFDLDGQGLHIDIELGVGAARTLNIHGSDTRWQDLQV